jgi:hypothetical protein
MPFTKLGPQALLVDPNPFSFKDAEHVCHPRWPVPEIWPVQRHRTTFSADLLRPREDLDQLE